MDKSKASYNALRNAVNLAKLVDGSIDILQVKSPTSVVRYENQIASMRAIGDERSKQKKELKNIMQLIAKEEGIPMQCNFTFGNVRNEIKNHIEKTKPDIVVLGKRKKKLVNFLGDHVTKDLLKTHKGSILISGNNDDAFSLYNNKSIGFLNTIDGIDKLALTNDLKKLTKKPLKIFKINHYDAPQTTHVASVKVNEHTEKKKTIVYEFDAKDNAASGMANFISKNNLALLCIKKDKNNGSLLSRLNKTLTTTIEKTNIPVLILNNN
jgi:nucleotide-binding universal stress UspA family protein